MDYVLKSTIHNVIGETILADIRSQRSSYYFFVGGVAVPGVTYTTDADPSYQYELATRNEIVSLKKINDSDVSYVIPRINWTTATVYDQYDDYTATYPSFSGSTILDTALFYVVTTDFQVYKCLFNNNNAQSTVMPTSTLAAPFYTSDGYRWKFMYSIPLSSRTRFMNSAFIPVQTALLDQFYSAGLITTTALLNKGVGYTEASILIDGDGTGAILTPVISGGQIIQVLVTNPGVGYTYANLSVTGDGTGASIVATLSVGDLDTTQADVELLAVRGSLEAYRITNPGAGYSQATVSIVGDGSGAAAHVVISNGGIASLIVDTPGQDYTFATITITGDGQGATAIPIIAPYGGHGKNAINELYATRLSFFSNLLNDPNQGLAINNQFRQIGIIRNPQQYDSDRYYTQLLASGCMLITYSGPIPNLNDLMTDRDTGKRFRVVAVVGQTLLAQNLDNYDLPGDSVLLNTNTGGQITELTIVEPDIDRYSGDLIFIDNFGINQQAGQQIIIFKTTLKF
jgi:hypothetical protein